MNRDWCYVVVIVVLLGALVTDWIRDEQKFSWLDLRIQNLSARHDGDMHICADRFGELEQKISIDFENFYQLHERVKQLESK